MSYRRVAAAVVSLTIGASVGAVVASGSPAHAAGGAVTIDAPAAPTAGRVELTGTVTGAAGATTSVLYVYDTTDSTALPKNSDCSNNGSAGADDDFNGDGSVGDVLDCEIAGAIALNASLASTSNVQAGVVAFADDAAAADLDPHGSATFVAPSYTGGDYKPRIETAARSVTRGHIGLYDPKALGGSGAGTAFNSAIRVALDTLATAPAGPKWIMFLSDGQAAIDDALLDRLAQSGVRLRSFGIGAGASCLKHSSLYKMAAVTGEQCSTVARPASLGAGLVGAQPDAVNGVSVTIKNVSVAAQINAVGGWTAAFNLGAGTYNATATAVLASGAKVVSQRTFTVAAAPGGPGDGSVGAGAGSLLATSVKVRRPAATRDALPADVVGKIGVPHGKRLPKVLKGSKVRLEARAAAGDKWTTVDRGRVDKRGRFHLSWHPKRTQSLLRVTLLPRRGYAGTSSAVPSAPISACKVKSRSGGWTLTCHTTAPDRSSVRLVKGGAVVDRARTQGGTFKLHGAGAVNRYTVDLKVGKGRHIWLRL
ncbi:hypothetical protein [uncultured Nocardioides sp.]|uniref:hypothetical protein n=1 Tax=uncultured Nocardioides sp. TaxID=198441 RepID=UPI00261DCB99|nr:hypothetical protein [uncultured Nocardioides sp.]HRD62782.1 hypothetical protein [Nocardioides sp.]